MSLSKNTRLTRFQPQILRLTINHGIHHPCYWARAIGRLVQERKITTTQFDKERAGRERILVLGSGWGGYTIAQALDKRKYQVIIISPRSYFAFTPLLASASTGTLEFRNAVEPVRTRRSKVGYIQGWADAVDFVEKVVTVEEAVRDPRQGLALTGTSFEARTSMELDGDRLKKSKKGQLFDIGYDKLVISVGCYAQTFNTPGVKQNANFLKDTGDSRRIRKRILECFETAALPTTPERVRKQILNFAVVGGGPTGVEFSAELHDLISEDLSKIYPELAGQSRITVYDVAPKVLGMFDAELGNYALEHFKREGIEVKTSHHVESLVQGLPNIPVDDQDGRPGLTLTLKETGPIGVGMVVWSTGLMSNPFIAKGIGRVKSFPQDQVITKDGVDVAKEAEWSIRCDKKSGSIYTNDRLRVVLEGKRASGEPLKAHMKDCFAIGDCAMVEGAQHPATAQVANQKADWLAKRLNKGDLQENRFAFKNLGVMAYLGNWDAILEGGKGQKISGRTAWFLWRSAYLYKSVSWRNRVLIPMYWFLNWLFGRDISRF